MEAFSTILLESLLFLHGITGNLGLAIIFFTIVLRTILLPLTIPSIKISQKIRELQPELTKLKNKHKKNKKALQQAQLELYKKYNVNPVAGCLPQIIQIGILILLYRVLINFLISPESGGVAIDPYFLWMNLGQPDPLYIVPLVAAGSQLVLSLMIAPGGEKRDIVPNKSKSKKVQEENKQEEGFAEMAASMQKQMIFLMPIMTGVIALQFPSGLALYWIVTTIYGVGQQYYISGPGGLRIYTERILNLAKTYGGQIKK